MRISATIALVALCACNPPAARSAEADPSRSAGAFAALADVAIVDATTALHDAPSSLAQRPTPDAALLALDAASDATPPEVDTAGDRPESFSSPTSLAALARDPRWHPERDAPEPVEDPLACAFATSSQSCVSEPCHEGVGEPCRAQCARTCTRCDASCRPSCVACHRACTTDACRMDCARTCAGCLDGCRAAKDRCVSGPCTRRQEACFREFGRSFVSQCLPRCRECYAQCEQREDMYPCINRCARARCSASQTGFCVMVGAVDPLAPTEGS
jgi:hypothetical protein